jgi:hypothetical protein
MMTKTFAIRAPVVVKHRPLIVAEEEAVAVVQDRPPVFVVVGQEAEHAVYFGDRRRRRAGTGEVMRAVMVYVVYEDSSHGAR